MTSFDCPLNRILWTLYLLIILNQINVCNKCVFCEPQRGWNNRRPFYDLQYDDYPGSFRNDYYEEGVPNGQIMNYMTELTKSEKEENRAILDDLIKPPPISARGSSTCDRQCTQCMASCNFIKTAKGANSAPLVQYLYLAVCSKGCKKMIGCINDKYCLPVMRENPDYFIQCVNSCPLFPIIPKVFIK